MFCVRSKLGRKTELPALHRHYPESTLLYCIAFISTSHDLHTMIHATIILLDFQEVEEKQPTTTQRVN